MRVMVVMGTRPEAIKLCPVIERLRRRSSEIETSVVVTHQHQQMLDDVLDVFGVKADHDLSLMRDNQTLNEVAWKLIQRIDPILVTDQPTAILVQGDTVTAAVTGLAAFYRRIPVGHVEAGLRTGDRTRPYPEEMNRRLLGTVAGLHFAPTSRAVSNLLREGVPRERVFLTGNTVVDALQWIIAGKAVRDELTEVGNGRRVVLVTAHRRENFGAPMESICSALLELVEKNPDIEIVYPVHLNPNVREVVFRMLRGKDRIRLLEPLDYVSFVQLMHRSTLIITDSGGIQEEAPSLGKPVLILRSETERPEVLEAGVGELVGTEGAAIVSAAQRLLDDAEAYRERAHASSPFGDGTASEQIVQILVDRFSGGGAGADL
jgi:UDP-N-acetylglucosamine 2-epimerase (non-hydrolysing)